MMAAYTILAPAARSCPVKFKSGDFWQNLGSPPTQYGEPSIEITNASTQSIRKVVLLSGYFVNTPQYLRRTPADASGGANGHTRPRDPGPHQALRRHRRQQQHHVRR